MKKYSIAELKELWGAMIWDWLDTMESETTVPPADAEEECDDCAWLKKKDPNPQGYKQRCANGHVYPATTQRIEKLEYRSPEERQSASYSADAADKLNEVIEVVNEQAKKLVTSEEHDGPVDLDSLCQRIDIVEAHQEEIYEKLATLEKEA